MLWNFNEYALMDANFVHVCCFVAVAVCGCETHCGSRVKDQLECKTAIAIQRAVGNGEGDSAWNHRLSYAWRSACNHGSIREWQDHIPEPDGGQSTSRHVRQHHIQ